MLKLKFNGMSESVKSLLNDVAEHLQMYDPRISEKDQCAGYHVLKEMCLMKEKMCTYEEFEFYRDNPYTDKQCNKCPIGYYLLAQIHPNARKITLDAVNKVRHILSKGLINQVTIKKKVKR